MATTKNTQIPYYGGVFVLRPAGQFVDEETKELKTYGDVVKIVNGQKFPPVLTPADIRALYENIRANKDFAAFVGIKTGIL